MGPYSIGFLYVAPQWRDGKPLEHNWIARRGAENFAALVDYQDAFQPGARRYDVGERSNFALLPMLNEALAMLLEWQVPAIGATLATRNATIAERAAELGLASLPRSRRAPHFLGLRLPAGTATGIDGRAVNLLAERMSAERVFLSIRGESIRITPHLYNTPDDEARLLQVLADVLRALCPRSELRNFQRVSTNPQRTVPTAIRLDSTPAPPARLIPLIPGERSPSVRAGG